MTFAKLFKSLRKDLKLTQAAMARVLGASQAHISEVESGVRPPRIDVWLRAHREAFHLGNHVEKQFRSFVRKFD